MTIAVAFLRCYDERDFSIFEFIGQPRVWSNRFTVAAAVVALVNFCVVERSLCAAWNRRNCLKDTLRERETGRTARAEAQAADDRAASVQRRAEEAERATRRARVEVEQDLAFLSFLAEPVDKNRQKLTQTIALLDQYRGSL